MSISCLNAGLIGTDKFLDKVPVFSTLSNLIDIFQKVVIAIAPCACNTPKRYYTYLKAKEFWQCLVLLIPVLGNIAIYLYRRNELIRRKEYADILRNEEGAAEVAAKEAAALKKQTKEQNKEKVLSNLRSDGLNLQHHLHYNNDKDAVNAALDQNPLALEHVSINFKNKYPDVVKAAIRKNPEAYAYANHALKCDVDFAVEMVQKNHRVLMLMGAVIYDKEFFEKLYRAQPELSKDKPFVILALHRSDCAFESIDEALKGDLDVLRIAYKDHKVTNDPPVKDARDFILRAFKTATAPFLLEHMSNELRKDPDIFLGLLKKIDSTHPKINYWISLIPTSLLENREFVKAAVALHGMIFQRAHTFHNDAEIALIAFKQTERAGQFFGDKIKNKSSFQISVLEIEKASGKESTVIRWLFSNRELTKKEALKLLKDGYKIYSTLKDHQKRDPEIAKAAVFYAGYKISELDPIVGDPMRKDKKLALAFLKKKLQVYSDLDATLQKDLKVAIAAFKTRHYPFKEIYAILPTVAFAEAAAKIDGSFVKKLDREFLIQNPQIVLNAINQNEKLYSHFLCDDELQRAHPKLKEKIRTLHFWDPTYD